MLSLLCAQMDKLFSLYKQHTGNDISETKDAMKLVQLAQSHGVNIPPSLMEKMQVPLAAGSRCCGSCAGPEPECACAG